MKHIRILTLVMQSFRGERARVTDFYHDRTEICGCNGIGKSRHFDAFLWLLFGKDSQGRKDYEIKTRIKGKVMHGVDVHVECTLDVDGQTIKLRRSLVEVWTKPTGQVDAVFSGNKTVCAINDVPKSITQYNKEVFSIIDENLFLMLTNPKYFASMPWQKQREQLMAMIGTVDDAEIARENLDLQDLLDRLSGKSLDDYRKEVLMKKRKIKEELAGIQPRIDQTYSLMPEEDRWDELEAKLTTEKAELEAICKEIAEEQKDCTAEDLQSKQSTIKAKMSNIEYFAKKDAQIKADKANGERKKIADTVASLRLDLQGQDSYAYTLRQQIASIKNILQNAEAEREELREKYRSLSKLTFSDYCPYCGQELPEKMKADGYEKFTSDVQQRKARMNEKGFHLKEQIDKMNAQLADAENNIKLSEASTKELEASIKRESEKLEDMPIVCPVVDLTENEEYIHLQKQLQSIQDKINGHRAAESPRLAELRQKKEETNVKIAYLNSRLHNRETIKQYKDAIETLNVKAKKLAEEIASYEKDECLINQFSLARTTEMENRISKMFGENVSFCFYDKTIDGNLVETCYPLVNGVPYNAANTAAKINAGLSIINALCKFYDVSAPIFIDNAESVNTINPDVVSQIIELKVTKDTKLIVK